MAYLTAITFTLLALSALFLIALHWGFQAPRLREQGTPADQGWKYETVRIPTVAGKQLFAWWLPTAESDRCIILLHGWGGNAELMLPMARPFLNAGMNVLLLDARNHGNSDGDTFSSLPRFAEDLEHAIDWLRQCHADSARQLVLLGHSVGAGAVLLTASRRRNIDAVISIAAFAHPEWMMKRYLGRFGLPKPMVRFILGYVQWIIGHRFSEIAPLHTVCRIDCPILLVHGRADATVPVEDARAIMNSSCEARLTLLEIDQADHDSVEKIEQHGLELIRFIAKLGLTATTTQRHNAAGNP